jgi:hypothetical protein
MPFLGCSDPRKNVSIFDKHGYCLPNNKLLGTDVFRFSILDSKFPKLYTRIIWRCRRKKLFDSQPKAQTWGRAPVFRIIYCAKYFFFHEYILVEVLINAELCHKYN